METQVIGMKPETILKILGMNSMEKKAMREIFTQDNNIV
jgi:hypothetical protein